jgi:hypothetical protein
VRPSANNASLLFGDMTDASTGPNDPLVFMLHHANVDRSNMIWQAKSLARNPRMGDDSVMWGYPANASAYPQAKPGCFLNDTISSYFPFEDLFDDIYGRPLTHFDVLDQTRPGKAPYKYDNMAAGSRSPPPRKSPPSPPRPPPGLCSINLTLPS